VSVEAQTLAPALAADGLRKVFKARGRGGGEIVAVEDLSFSLAGGESLGIVGESGSGKTTVARMLIALERPTAGTVVIGEQSWSGQRLGARARRRRGRLIQMVFQDPYRTLDPHQRVISCIEEILALHFAPSRAERRERAEALLADVGLDARIGRSLPRALSGGQRQRVAIARALAAEPDVLILDEAVAALDVSVQAQVLNVIADVRDARAISLIVITHDLAVAHQVADRLIVMRRGRIVEEGLAGDVLARPQDPYTQRLIASIPRPGWVPERALLGHADEQEEGP
jgi:oligopeptide transport system ATP-binding protein